MESKMKIAMIAIVAVVAVSCSALAITMMNGNSESGQDTTYSVEVRVFEDDQYKSYPAQGKTVSEILSNAFGDKVVVASNGNVKSFNGKENDSDHSWMTFRWMSHDGWVTADKSNLVQGASLALEYSEKQTVSGKTIYSAPDLIIKKEAYFFIQIKSLQELSTSTNTDIQTHYTKLTEWIDNSAYDLASFEQGFWIKGSGQDVNEALADAVHKSLFPEKTLTKTVMPESERIAYNVDGVEFHEHGTRATSYGWFLDFLGWTDIDLGPAGYTYWSQYTYNPNAPTLDDNRQWVYNSKTFGAYDMDKYHYYALLLQTTLEDGTDAILPGPSTIPEELKA